MPTDWRADEAVPGVVGTLMTNMAVELALRRRDVPLVRAKVGDRYVLEELAARGWQLGGEGSGHLLALDKHTTGDGIVSALQVLQAVRRAGGQSWPSCCDDVQLFPQTLINVRLADGIDWRSNAAWPMPQQAVERELGDGGRVLIRASGTEPVLRVMVEARDAGQSETLRGSGWLSPSTPEAALRRASPGCHKAANASVTRLSYRFPTVPRRFGPVKGLP